MLSTLMLLCAIAAASLKVDKGTYAVTECPVEAARKRGVHQNGCPDLFMHIVVCMQV